MLQDRENEEIHITATDITIETVDTFASIDLEEFLAEFTNTLGESVLEKCRKNLDRSETPLIPFSEYLDQDEPTKLNQLIALLGSETFLDQLAATRLETYFYLGEVLISRGEAKEDKSLLRAAFTASKTKVAIKTAKRVYYLFSARGLSQLYTVEYIKPSHLAGLLHREFYLNLIPEARRLKGQELLAE